MKNLMMIAAMMLMSMGAFAQEAGKMAIGVQGSYGLHKDYKNFGLGAKFQYAINEDFRLEASGDYFLKKDYVSQWDGNINVQYLIPISEGLYVYPFVGATLVGLKFDASNDYNDALATGAAMAGMSVSQFKAYCEANGIPLPSGSDFKDNETKFGFNAGAGIEYFVTEQFKVFLEAKYQYVKDFDRPVISLGAAYCF
jgi:outer membrane protein X